ncbi:MAG: hypothetical protein N7Q72_03050 [Spiroplasma sp. Tabriz.8]|nr:hypothetical protein [Spiroplasma sp. Tabriz.8]
MLLTCILLIYIYIYIYIYILYKIVRNWVWRTEEEEILIYNPILWRYFFNR